MGSSRHSASRRYHDRVARQYDSMYEDPFWEFHDRRTWELIKPYLPRDAHAPCADLGCGTGKWGMKLLKSGFGVTFVDHAAAMVGQAQAKVAEAGNGPAKRATFIVADIVEMPAVPSEAFDLILALGDPLSICSDPQRAVREMHRIARPGACVAATADNKLAAIDHYVERGNLEALEEFLQTGRTNWLTADERERFDLTTFTPASLRKLFERGGWEVVSLVGKTILPVRQNKQLFAAPDAMRRLLKMEDDAAKDPASAGRAGHLQIVARKK